MSAFFPPRLLARLIQYSNRATVPLHMPGHKRNTAAAPYLAPLGGGFDITEIHGFDNLHQPEGILKQSMEQAARLWGSDQAYFLVGGSTCGILAGIHAATQWGDSVLVARNCHQSVYHAIALCGLTPHYLLPAMDDTFGICCSLTPDQVARGLEAHPDVSLVILTSPTYDGVLSDIKAICQIAHARNIPVLVDEAHGAHLGFAPDFPGSAVSGGADLVIQSLHKTLPSLTQTALAHQNGTRIPPRIFAQSLRIFETSSPSYLLMASIDECVHLLATDSTLFSKWSCALEQFHRDILSLRHFRVLRYGVDRTAEHPGLFQWDPGKLLISTIDTPYTGPQLMETLRMEFDIELEMASSHSALAMTGLCTTQAHLSRLSAALRTLDENCCQAVAKPSPRLSALCLPAQAMNPNATQNIPQHFVPLAQAVGRITGESLWAYPPGIPLLIPGEVLCPALLEQISEMQACGVTVHSTFGGAPETLSVLDTNA
ncbi:MAG: aminotransferase class I/II-fold pyridoxal phosphate-dependent enzyme [Oscillospiraceae bacterium]|nr:aminotransferase class I/II-fold pyridoxal phosphate-dependent enzyme [Oscillospiraceae bacterium]